MSHTKGPWVAKETIDGWNIYSGRMPVPVWNIEIAKAEFAKDEEEAKHIVRCVNSHDDLLEAAKLTESLISFLIDEGRISFGSSNEGVVELRALRTAIAKAEPDD